MSFNSKSWSKSSVDILRDVLVRQVRNQCGSYIDMKYYLLMNWGSSWPYWSAFELDVNRRPYGIGSVFICMSQNILSKF